MILYNQILAGILLAMVIIGVLMHLSDYCKRSNNNIFFREQLEKTPITDREVFIFMGGENLESQMYECLREMQEYCRQPEYNRRHVNQNRYHIARIKLASLLLHPAAKYQRFEKILEEYPREPKE